MVRIVFEVAREPALEHVHDGARALGDVGIRVQVPLGTEVALVHLAQQVDQLVQGLAGLGHGVSFDRRDGLRGTGRR